MCELEWRVTILPLTEFGTNEGAAGDSFAFNQCHLRLDEAGREFAPPVSPNMLPALTFSLQTPL